MKQVNLADHAVKFEVTCNVYFVHGVECHIIVSYLVSHAK